MYDERQHLVMLALPDSPLLLLRDFSGQKALGARVCSMLCSLLGYCHTLWSAPQRSASDTWKRIEDRVSMQTVYQAQHNTKRTMPSAPF